MRATPAFQRKRACGYPAAGLWSGARVSFCCERWAPGAGNHRSEKSPESGLRSRVLGGRRPSKTESPLLSDPCAPGRALPVPHNASLSSRFLRPGLSCSHVGPWRRLWALTGPVVASSSTLGGVREPRTKTSLLPSPGKIQDVLFFALCKDLLQQRDPARGTSSAQGEGPRRKPGVRLVDFKGEGWCLRPGLTTWPLFQISALLRSLQNSQPGGLHGGTRGDQGPGPAEGRAGVRQAR